jgi:hypothetical protein
LGMVLSGPACYARAMLVSRRGLITGLASLVAAPAIVRVGALMPVKAFVGDGAASTITALSMEHLLRLRLGELGELLVSPPLHAGLDLEAAWLAEYERIGRRLHDLHQRRHANWRARGLTPGYRWEETTLDVSAA